MAKLDIFWGMSEDAIRQRVVAEAVEWLGTREGTAKHKKIVDGYNSQAELPRDYQLQYDDPWCAGFLSFIGISLGISDVILPEVGCDPMIKLYKAQGRWMEADDYVPKPGDIWMADWGAKKGECTGDPEHVELVEWCDGKSIGLIGGNSDNRVQRRTIPVEYIYTRGFCLPDYAALVWGFSDVDRDKWYFGDVAWTARKGIARGITETEFAPELTCTRSHVVTMLWRALGAPKSKTAIPFTDVGEDTWYADAVRWAAEKGITEGIAEGQFAPELTCTRAQVMTMLWRSVGTPQPETMDTPFCDVTGDCYYVDAVAWGWCKGITIGCGAGEFRPHNSCTRAQVAAMLHRLYE